VAALTAGSLGSALLAGCADSSSNGSVRTIAFGVSGNIFDMPIRVADANGYFAKQGLKLTYVTTTAATATPALESGSIQFLNDSPTDFLAAVGEKVPETAIAADAGGNPLALVVSTRFADTHQLTATTPAAEVAKALAGSTGGASSANTKGEARLFLLEHAVDPEKVTWVSLPSPAADKAALKTDQIDWFVTSQPIPAEIQESGDGVVVADSLKVPQWSEAQAGYGQLVVARDTYLSAHPDIARKVATAVQQATAYMNAHLDSEVVQTVAQKALPGVPAPVLKAVLPQVEWPTSGKMSLSEWVKTASFVNSLRAVKGHADVPVDRWTNEYLP
jgi:NitT/TauT family transport system substrate-binding protein